MYGVVLKEKCCLAVKSEGNYFSKMNSIVLFLDCKIIRIQMNGEFFTKRS